MATKKKIDDPRGSWTKLYREMITCHAYRALSMTARCLLWDMKSMVNGTNNGSIGAPFSVMKKQFGWTSSSALSKSLYELRAMGFIALTKQGGFKEGDRVCSLYRFTDLPVYEHKESGRQAVGRTFDYDNTHFKSLAEAKALLDVRVAEYRAEGRRRQRKIPLFSLRTCRVLVENSKRYFRVLHENREPCNRVLVENTCCVLSDRPQTPVRQGFH